MSRELLAGQSGRTLNVLREDPELLEAVATSRRAAAEQAARAAVLEVPTGIWDLKDEGERARDGYGFLLMRGLLVRRVGFENRFGAELLGPGDLLRPLEHDGEEATLPFEAAWRVLEPLRVAVLDRRWSFRMAAAPEIGITLAARAIRRSRRLANTLAISQHPKLDVRIHLMFWELADRYGYVHPDGVHLRLRLTHETLSHLAGARRPSVSSALARLVRAGAVDRRDDGWLLRGSPPDYS